VREAEHGLGAAAGVGRMDVAFDDIVAHQPINDIGAFAVGGADHRGMPEKVPLVDDCAGADALTLPEIPERAAGRQAIMRVRDRG